jgi:hypothetical protein
MKKIIPVVILNFLIAVKAQAFCPVCTVAVGAGVGLSRWLGIDDSITGLWVGGLTVSVSIWTINWLKKKNYNFKLRALITFIFYYALIVLPLFFMGIIGHPFNKLWGVDRLLLGVIIGSIAFYAAGAWYQHLKKKNNDRAHFPFQKVAMPILALVVLSFVFYYLTR